MTTPISQVKYWLDEASGMNNADDGADAGTYLSYDIFLGLSVLGGYFGLDHLYLRSPLTFIAKFIVNVMCFGVWWIYDAAQAIFHADVVKVYGLGMPGWGPLGIGAGVLVKDVPDKKHLRFLVYSAALLFGGMFGLDSFITGDKQFGFIRLICTISLIFFPVSGFEWGYKLYEYFINTEDVIDDHYKFFGAPHRSMANRLRSRFPILSWIFSPFESFKNLVNSVFGPALFEPITKTAQAAINTVDHAVSAVDNTVQFGRNVLSKSSEIVDQVGQTLDTLSQATTVMPAASLYATAQQGLQAATQQGGAATLAGNKIEESNLNTMGYILLAVFSLVIVTGLVSTIYRAYHEQRDKSIPAKQHNGDDVPPEPIQSKKGNDSPSQSGVL